MEAKDLLSKELSFEEMNDWLGELMGYSCNNPEDSSESFHVFDEYMEYVDFRKYIGMKALNTLSGVLLLKEKIDEERGEWFGKTKIQQTIKKVLDL